MRLAAGLLVLMLLAVGLPTSSATHQLSAEGDAALLALAATRGWPGTGAPGDPILIVGLTHRLLVSHVSLDLRFVDPTIALGTSRSASGIALLNVSEVTIENARISGGGLGIFIADAERVLVQGGEITGARTAALALWGGQVHPSGEFVVDGIRIAGSEEAIELDHVGPGLVEVRNATLEDNDAGIDATFFSSAATLAIHDNDIARTAGAAILVDRPNAFVRSNDIVQAGVGIEVRSARDGAIIDANHVTDAGVGIRTSARDVEVRGNRIEGGGIGLQVLGATGVTARANLFLDNNMGASIVNSLGVLVHDNVFDNLGTNAEELSSDARWSIEPQPGTNVLGGPTIAGNAWNDNLCFDREADGICDGAYLPLRPRPRQVSFGVGGPPLFDLFPLVFGGQG